jgi:site-specific DNA-methyltransferase (adenine-specific)
LNEQKCDIYECSTSSQQRLQIEHPTPKNEKFITKYIEALSREGGTVLDCFNGSGASIVACKMAKRNCISIEIEPKYIEVCKKRLNWGSSLNPNIEWEFKEVI